MVPIICKTISDDYEVVGIFSSAVSSCAQLVATTDVSSTESFLHKFGFNTAAWRNLLTKLNIDFPHNSGCESDFYKMLAHLCIKRKLQFFKLPKIESLHAIPYKKEYAICLVQGPIAPRSASKRPLKINSTEEANALLKSLNATETQLFDSGRFNTLKDFAFNDGKNYERAVVMLANKKLLAYKVQFKETAKVKKQEEYIPRGGVGDRKVETIYNKSPQKNPSLAERKGVPPKSLHDAVNRLNSMKDHIATNGHQPKYSDAELIAQAQKGDVAKERYHVRFMEAKYAKPTGMLGQELQGSSGTGAKYWSTTFDQIEDADSDPKLICEKLGLVYDNTKIYTLIIVDTQVAAPLTGVASVPATFKNVSEFANRELPDEFPKSFTDKTMNPEFQQAYAEHHAAAVKSGDLANGGDNDVAKFENYLNSTDMSDADKKVMIKRMKMQNKIGNNQEYTGNGLTKNLIEKSPNQLGVVETLNFERNKVNLSQLEEKNAIRKVF